MLQEENYEKIFGLLEEDNGDATSNHTSTYFNAVFSCHEDVCLATEQLWTVSR